VDMSVGEVARRSGVSVAALHFYERKGLIRSRRSGGNQRRYERDILRRVALIQVAREVGIPLVEVGLILESLPDRRTPSRKDWAAISKAWAADLDRRMALLQRLKENLTGCIGCGCLSMTRCTILNPGDKLARRGSGPVRLRQATEPSR
jgi:MerR family transcriptional regulator, redox-sensitive transcriptional activator SoxR